MHQRKIKPTWIIFNITGRVIVFRQCREQDDQDNLEDDGHNRELHILLRCSLARGLAE
jgi:hypothetical protein